MKRRLAMLTTALGLAALLAGGMGARQADCQDCPGCEKELNSCLKVNEYKCKQACADAGPTNEYHKCMQACSNSYFPKCLAQYKACGTYNCH